MAKKAMTIGLGAAAAPTAKVAPAAAMKEPPARTPPNKTAPARRNPIGNLGKWAHPSAKGKKK